MAKKSSKRLLSCLCGGSGKVQFRQKKLGDKVQAKSSNLSRRFCSNSVRTPLEFAAFRNGFDAKYSRASAFCFFCPQPWFLRRSEHICQEKHQHFHADRQLVTKKEISIKTNFKADDKRSWPSGLVSGFIFRRPRFGSQRG